MIWLAVFIGGFMGAPLRFLIDWAIPKRTFPVGVLAANVLGCFLFGLFTTHFSTSPTLHLWLTTGFCGALTTFSTFSFDVLQAISREQFFRATANIVLSVGLGYLALQLGISL